MITVLKWPKLIDNEFAEKKMFEYYINEMIFLCLDI